MPMAEVVCISEGNHKLIGFAKSSKNAAQFLVCRLFTDAVFSQDIRSIQTIINRIDGGLPKDTELNDYQTYFGDCLNEVMQTTDGTQLKIMPDDSVMMALCKSLYDLAVQDIYWDYEKRRPCRPSTERKMERDNAMRIVLERCGGRKTLTPNTVEKEQIEVASWIAELPENT